MSASWVAKVPIQENRYKALFGPLLGLKPILIAHIKLVLI